MARSPRSISISVLGIISISFGGPGATADVRVRLEYRQEKLHAFVQAREVSYPHARGHYKTEFAIIGDDFFDDGRVIAWRAALIVDGRIVATRQSYLWE